MSAIAGIVNFDGAPVNYDLLERMASAGVRRGPSDARRWVDGSAGFVYCGTLPAQEGWFEQQPLCDTETGIVVMLDGRVDARRELRAACAAAGHPARTFGDAELVLRAYQVWGSGCARYILGEYTFAVWDPANRRLVCARDAAGVRPLFYAHTFNGSFRFGTGANQILADPALPRTADVAGIVDSLASMGTSDPHRTPCLAVKRLPAAHTLVIDAHGVRIHRYWSLDDDEMNQGLSKQDDHVEACAEALQLAIRDRLRGGEPVGISLSGGWDSGAIFTLWQWMRSQGEPLPEPWSHTFYFDYPEADEREEVQVLLRRWPAKGTFMHAASVSALTGLEEHVLQLGMPEPAFGWYCVQEQMVEARAAGIRTMLSGEGGNFVLQSSLFRLADLLRAGRLRAVYTQMGIWAEEFDRPARKFLWPYTVKPALSVLLPRLWGIAKRIRRATSSISPPYLRETLNGISTDITPPLETECRHKSQEESLAARDQRVRLEQLYRQMFTLYPGADLEGIFLSAPYFDRRVMRVTLAALTQEVSPMSSRELLGRVLERTVGHRLPGNYTYVDRAVNDALQADLRAGNPLFTASTLVELGIVDRDRLKIFLAGYASGQDQHWLSVWHLVSTEAWARCWLADS